MGAWRLVNGRRKDGTEFALQAGISKTGLEEPVTFTLIGLDMTERLQAEQSLRDSEQRYRSLFENMLDGYLYGRVLLDDQEQPQDFICLEVNHAFETLTGLAEVVGRKFSELPPSIRAANLALIEKLSRVAATGVAERFEINVAALGHRWLSVAVYSPAKGYFVAVFDNVTQRKRREREMGATAAVAAALRTASNRADMLPVVLDQVLDLLQAGGTALELHDPVSGESVIEATSGAWAGGAGLRIPAGQSLGQRVMASGRPYVSDDVAAEQPPFAQAPLVSIRTAACVPLMAHGQTFGALWAGRLMPFTPDDIRLLTTIADMAASAIQRATLHEQTERRLHQLTALRAIDVAISTNLDLLLTLSVLVSQVTSRLEIDAADVQMLDSHPRTLVYAVGRGFRLERLARPHEPLGQSYAGRVVLDQRMISLPSGADQEPHAAFMPRGEGFHAYYGVPLIAKGQVAGVLEIFHRAPLHPDADWLEFLEALAGQAAIAIENARLFDDLARSNVSLTEAYNATIEGWSRALDLRDKETEGHSQRVTALTLRLATVAGVPSEQMLHLRRGALLHDIGKMGVPDRILLKPGPLTDDEWVVMRLHPQFAYDMLSPIAYLRPALDIPYGHHERWDGTGYPRGLSGEAIPLAARIFAVADVWDALRSERLYRPPWPAEQVREYIKSMAGRQFEPAIVTLALETVLAGEADGRS